MLLDSQEYKEFLIRQDFPVFNSTSGEKPFIFLDNAAASQMPLQVIEAVTEYYSSYKANIHSSIYAMGARASEAYDKARIIVADFIGADKNEVVFTSGTTASLNMLARMLVKFINTGDEVIVSVMEHHSNFIPWQIIAREQGAVFTVVPLEEDGRFSLDSIRAAINKRTKIIAVTHVSHALGIMNNVKEISRMAHEVGALCVIDAAQSVPHGALQVKDIGCDFLVFSGQKMLAPTGTGVLYGKKSIFDELDPSIFGGGMIRSVDVKESSWAYTPEKFEAGTPHIAGVIGLAKAITYLQSIGMDWIYNHEKYLTEYALKKIQDIQGVRVFGCTDIKHKRGIISFELEGVHPHDVAEVLSRENIAVRAGHHCAMPLMKHLGISGTVRASFYIYNTREDADRLVEGIEKAKNIFKGSKSYG